MMIAMFQQKIKVNLVSSVWLRTVTATLLCGVVLQPSAAPHTAPAPAPDATLRQAAAAHHITIGAAAASKYLAEADYAAILGSEFSQLQAENEMKFGPIHPRPDTDPNPYDFRGGDALVAFAQSHTWCSAGILSSGITRCRAGS